MNTLEHHPAQLWVGHPTKVHETVITYLQELWCQQQACKQCYTCVSITQRQHHNLLWIQPTKLYTLESLEPIFSKIAFSLEAGQKFIIIIQAADTLSALCANRLLKSLEEPPAGYHFILTAQQQDHVLDTIVSRCVVRTHQSLSQAETAHPLFDYFTRQWPVDALLFMTALEKAPLNEQESISIFYHIIAYWHNQYTIMVHKGAQTRSLEKILACLQESSKHLPMPGSSKLFWKNLFLKMRA